MTKVSKNKPASPNPIFIGHESGDDPDQVRFFEIDFDTNGKGVSLSLGASGWISVKNMDQAKTAVGDALKYDRFPNPGHTKHPPVVWPRPDKWKRTGLSLRAPASGVDRNRAGYPDKSDFCLFVIRLANGPGNSQTDWRFSTYSAPFSGDGNLNVNGQQANANDYFSDAAFLRLDGGGLWEEQPDKTERLPEDPYAPATWAWFLFNAKKARDDTKNDFVFRYNIHVEVKDRKYGNYIPLILDPDIGYPEGGDP